MTLMVRLFFLFVACGLQIDREVQMRARPNSQRPCLYWYSRVDPRIKLPQDEKVPDVNDERELQKGIACLLQLEGNENPSSIKGATSPRTSQTFSTTSVQVAALYYVSYLYYEKWDHAHAAVLVDESSTKDQKKTVAKAFEAYRRWFGEVKKIGLHEARKAEADPLAGSGIRWY